nr:antitoxin Xre/MbcA/ParS toxin-binding domain-containing protein [Motilibacter aurantiacus]
MIAELLLRDPDGSRLDRVDDPDALARETAGRVVDTAAAWEAHLGAFYDVEGVRTLLSRGGRLISKQAVSKRKGLLALTTGSGRVVYPRFQFADGAPLAGLDDVLAELPEPLVSRWTVASWLVSPQPALDGERPVDVLREGSPAPVAAAARGWARSLAA